MSAVRTYCIVVELGLERIYVYKKLGVFLRKEAYCKRGFRPVQCHKMHSSPLSCLSSNKMPPWVLFLQMQELRRIKGSLDALINQRDNISETAINTEWFAKVTAY